MADAENLARHQALGVVLSLLELRCVEGIGRQPQQPLARRSPKVMTKVADPESKIAAILAVDWGKLPKKRAVYVAETSARTVRRLEGNWSLDALVRTARTWQGDGAVIIAIDAPLGVPAEYFSQMRAQLKLKEKASFLGLLGAVPDDYFDVVKHPRAWRHQRPFFSVLAGKDGLGAFKRKAGCEITREVDRRTRAKSPFIASGIPGSVGSGAIELWRQLRTLRADSRLARAVKVWPFEGALDKLTRKNHIILAETYPRACYSIALRDCAPEERPITALAKTRHTTRTGAIQALQEVRQHWAHSVEIENLDEARHGEDDFDACLTAVALLRATLDGTLFRPTSLVDRRAEGGILGLSAVNLDLAQLFLQFGSAATPASTRAPRPSRARSDATKAAGPVACPIPGCAKVFGASRGGWDAHVGFLRKHPTWRRSVGDPAARRRAFEDEFPGFFRKGNLT